jgi:hypothetical protein
MKKNMVQFQLLFSLLIFVGCLKLKEVRVRLMAFKVLLGYFAFGFK